LTKLAPTLSKKCEENGKHGSNFEKESGLP
jgi:hypothetical protein